MKDQLPPAFELIGRAEISPRFFLLITAFVRIKT
jgi:hypothetical protein